MNELQLTDDEIVLIAFLLEDYLWSDDMEEEAGDISRQIQNKYPALYKRGINATL
jgi:hypothetical protein